MNKKLLSLLIAAGLVLGASQASAANITIADNDPTANGFGGGPLGTGGEDNETEGGTISSQVWDMEAFVINASNPHTLYIVGGYNMQAGESGSGGSVVSGKLTPGDLFIKIGGAPGFGPTAPNSGNTTNIYGYNYVVDLTQPVEIDPALAQAVHAALSSAWRQG